MLQSHGELTLFKQHRKSVSAEKSGIVGPFVAIVGDATTTGDAEDTATEVFIVINEFDFKISSGNVIEAIDYCYKSCFALNSDFPCECKHIYSFLQSYIYKNNLEYVKDYIVVNKFITDLNKFV